MYVSYTLPGWKYDGEEAEHSVELGARVSSPFTPSVSFQRHAELATWHGIEGKCLAPWRRLPLPGQVRAEI